MSTVIDQAVDAFIAAIAPTPGITGVYESRQQPFTVDDSPAIEVALSDASAEVLGDNSHARSIMRVVLQIDMSIYTRSAIDAAGQEQSARSLASPVWAAAHQRLMADPTLGGMAVRVRWQRSQWRTDAADGTAGWASHSYAVLLAARELDLAQPNTALASAVH